MIEYFSKGSNGLYLVTFGLSVELVGQRFKTAVGMLFGLPYSIGEMVLGATVVCLRDWRTLHMVFNPRATPTATVRLNSSWVKQ